MLKSEIYYSVVPNDEYTFMREESGLSLDMFYWAAGYHVNMWQFIIFESFTNHRWGSMLFTWKQFHGEWNNIIQ